MLTGLRVLDFTRVLAGPLCTMMLGDLGADILKVERPDTGDDTRGWGPPFDADGASAYYLSVNRNKCSLTADFAREDDRELLRRLIADADVVVDNFRRGTLERHGLDPLQLLADHPRLIWCTISGFGPDSDRPGYDFVVQAECGWMAITGEPEGQPMKVGVALADVLAGKDAALAILAAVAARGLRPGDERTANQRLLHVSLAGSATAALVNVAQNVLVSGTDARRWGNAHPNLVPYRLFAAVDGDLILAVGSDAQWRALAGALEPPELAADERYGRNAGRVMHRDALVAVLAGQIATRTVADWLLRFEPAGVPAGRVKSVVEALAEVESSPLWGVAPSVPGAVRRPPPALGADDALVRSVGWKAFAN